LPGWGFRLKLEIAGAPPFSPAVDERVGDYESQTYDAFSRICSPSIFSSWS